MSVNKGNTLRKIAAYEIVAHHLKHAKYCIELTIASITYTGTVIE